MWHRGGPRRRCRNETLRLSRRRPVSEYGQKELTKSGSGHRAASSYVGVIEVTVGDAVSVEARLRDFQSITDAALSRLDDRDLLAELLDRTREVLQADTAAVLLLDFGSGQLIATAAAGLEEEVSQGVRIPVGRGFAGRIAAEHKPVVLDRVDHTTVMNPILWAKGIQSMVGVPMVAGGRVIGVLHVGSATHRPISPPLAVCAVRHCVAWETDWFARVAPGKNRGTKEAVMPERRSRTRRLCRITDP